MKLTRKGLANEVADLLGYERRAKANPSFRVVNAMIESISRALLRGETVKIDGFGRFKIREILPTRRVAYFYPYLRQKGLHWEVLDIPAKRRVVFIPSKALIKHINLVGT